MDKHGPEVSEKEAPEVGQVNLRDSNLSCANMGGACVCGAHLYRTKMWCTNLRACRVSTKILHKFLRYYVP